MWRAVSVIAIASAVIVSADVRATKRDAATAKQKVAILSKNGETPSKIPRRTIVSEAEVNSYLAYEAREQIPVGLVEPYIAGLGPGRLSVRAIVDLDAVRKQKAPTSLLDPMNYLMGRLAVTAIGTLKTANGVGQLGLESARIGSLPIPKILLQEIVSYYSRTPEKPAGIGLDDRFELPAHIREIHVQRGQAIIVQ